MLAQIEQLRYPGSWTEGMVRVGTVSSVDLNLDDLGYAAAHLLIGDVPVKADRLGNIAIQPTLIDRGSVGRPRRESHALSKNHSAPPKPQNTRLQ